MISLKNIFESDNPEKQYIKFGNEKRPLTTMPSLRGGEVRSMKKDKNSLYSLYKEIVDGQEDNTDAPTGFKENPMQYILSKYKKLKSELERLMGVGFEEYIDGIFIVSGKPTTFKIHLKNHQYFFMTYMGRGIYEATVLGKRYYLSNLGDVQRATKAISRIQRFGPDLPIKGPNEESGPDSEKPEADIEEPETPEEEPEET